MPDDVFGQIHQEAQAGSGDIFSLIHGDNISSESYMAAHPPVPGLPVMSPSYSALAVSNSPTGSDPHNPGNPNLNAVPNSARGLVNDSALSTQSMAIGGGPFAEAAITGSVKPLIPVAKSVVGAVAGKYLGREAGGLVGHPEIGGTVGSIAGGLYGGVGGKIPTKDDLLRLFQVHPDFQEPGAHLPSVEEFYANKGKDIIAAMKQQPGAFELPTTGKPGGGFLPSTEKFYEQRGREIMAAMRQQPDAFLPPEKAAAAKALARAESTGVSVVPEPRGNFSGEVPNYMASVPRATLHDLAMTGKPGAGVQLQQLGQRIIYEPVGTGINNVKSSVSLADMAAVPPRGQEIYLRPNASGESGASLEAINRAASESAVGAKRIKIDTRSGNEIPLFGPDAVDAKAGPYDEIVMRDRNGNETILDRGQKALTRRSRR